RVRAVKQACGVIGKQLPPGLTKEQAIACPDCGPSLWFRSAAGWVRGSDAALAATQRALAARSAPPPDHRD
ncbi:hypothetical protein PJH48_28980, partial [Mycobacterium kansasii]